MDRVIASYEQAAEGVEQVQGSLPRERFAERVPQVHRVSHESALTGILLTIYRPSRFTLEQRLAITLMYHQHPTLRATQLAAAYGTTESRICQIISLLTQTLHALQLMPIAQHRCDP